MKIIVLSFCLIGLAVADVYDNCASDNCFVVPTEGSDAASCIASKNCELVVTYGRVSGGVQFEVQAEHENVDDGKHYVALGFSSDAAMGDDIVVACYGQQVENYWNIVNPHYSYPIGNANGINEASTSSANGKLSCSFVHDGKVTLDLPNELGQASLDLDANQYHLLLSTGPLDENGFVSYHEVRGATPTPIQL